MAIRLYVPESEYRKANARIFSLKADQLLAEPPPSDVSPEPGMLQQAAARGPSLDDTIAGGLEAAGDAIGGAISGAIERTPPPVRNFLGGALDILGRPQQAVFGGLSETQRQRTAGEDTWSPESIGRTFDAAGRGFRGEERRTGTDLVRQYGGTGSTTGDILAGLGVDLALDPLNVIPGKLVASGLSKAARGVGGAIADASPALGEFGRTVRSGFVPLADLPSSGRDLMLDTATAQRSAPAVAERSMSRFLAEIPEDQRAYLDKIVEARNVWEATPDATGAMVRTARDATDDEVAKNAVDMAIAGLSVDEIKKTSDAARKFIVDNIENPENALGINPAQLPWYFPRLVDTAEQAKRVRRGKASPLETSLGGFEESRTFMTRQIGEEAGTAYKLPVEALTGRLAASLRARSAQKAVTAFIQGDIKTLDGKPLIVKIGGSVDEGGKEIVLPNRPPDGYAEFSLPELKGHMAPAEVVGEIQDFYKTFIGDRPTKDFLEKYYDPAINFWKAAVTIIHPAFHVRNAYSNLYLMWLGGFGRRGFNDMAFDIKSGGGLVRLKQAADIQKGKPGELRIRDKVFSNEELGDLVTELGLMRSGQIGADIEKITLKGAAAWPIQKLFDVGRKVGTAIEDNARVAFFIDRLAKGDEIAQAVAQTRKHLYDYGMMAPFEKNVMRRAIPFYGWVRNNLPHMLETTVTQPAKVAATGKAYSAISQMSTGDPLTAAEAEQWPTWASEQLGIQVGRDEQGNPKVLAGLGLPIEDLNQLYKRTPERTMLGLMSMLGPPFRAVEYLMDMSSFTGKHISDPSYQNFYRKAYPMVGDIPVLRDWLEFKETTRQVLDDRTGKLVEKTFYSANPQRMFLFLALPTSRVMTSLGKATDVKALNETGRKSVLDTSLNLLTGARISSVDVTGGEAQFGVDTERLQGEYATRWQQAADQIAKGGTGKDYRDARSNILAEQRGGTQALLGQRVAQNTEGKTPEARDATRRSLLPEPGKALADYWSIDPNDPQFGGKMSAFFKARDDFLEKQSPETRQLINERKRDYIVRLRETSPLAAGVETAYQDALDQYREYQGLMDLTGMDEDTIELAQTYSRQLRDTSRALGGNPERAKMVLRAQDPDAALQYRVYQRVMKSTRGKRAKKMMQSYWAEHPLLQRFFSESALNDDIDLTETENA